ENPDCPVALQLFVDGRCVAEFATSKLRADVAATGIRAACAGFEHGWRPGSIKRSVEIDVRIKATGESLGKSPRPLTATGCSPRDTLYYDLHKAGKIRPVCVIVPVFNAYDAVEDCLESLVTHCPDYASVLIVN